MWGCRWRRENGYLPEGFQPGLVNEHVKQAGSPCLVDVVGVDPEIFTETVHGEFIYGLQIVNWNFLWFFMPNFCGRRFVPF